MNTYLVPVTAQYSEEPYDYLYPVYAASPADAYAKTYSKLNGYNKVLKQPEYESYPIDLNFEYYLGYTGIPFHNSYKNDILKERLKDEGVLYMGHFQVNWNDYVEELSNKANKENWSNETYPNKGILTNYLVHTYKRLKSEKHVIKKSE